MVQQIHEHGSESMNIQILGPLILTYAAETHAEIKIGE